MDLESVWRDLRYAIRTLRKDRSSLTLAVIALALGIGATTVIFSIVYSVMIDPFPYKDSRTLVQISLDNLAQPDSSGWRPFTAKEFFDFKTQNRVFSDMMACTGQTVAYKLDNTMNSAIAGVVDPDLFSGLGVKPMLGRDITSSDGEPGAAPVFLISNRMWREKFNRDPKAIGMPLTLNGTPRTLIGIMPPRFLLLNADIWIPMKITPDLTGAVVGDSANDPLFVSIWARLKSGVSLKQATADIDVIAHNEARIHPELYPEQFKISVRTIADRWTHGLRRMVYVLLAAVLMLLLIACFNVAILLLARATTREKELAIRAAAGALRSDLIRQSLIESFVLAAAGAVLGCFMACGGIQWLRLANPPGVPAEVEFRLNAAALLGTIGVTLLTTVLCGLPPALRASRKNLLRSLSGTGKGVGASAGHGRLRSVLVAAQMGLAILLLVGAGLMMRTFFALTNVDLGFNPKNILVAQLVFLNGQYATTAAKQAFFRQVLPRIGALPGVTSLTESYGLPVEAADRSEVTVPGSAHSETLTSILEFISEDYFRTVGLPLVRGRLLTAADIDSARKATVINKKLARDFFGDRNPIGRAIKLKELDDASFEIVGIVGDARNDGLENDPRPEAFLPHTVAETGDTILIRTAVAPDSILHDVRQVVSNVDQNVALTNTGSLESILHRDFVAAPEFGLVLLGIFATIGLLLSAIGVFSVISYTVAQQTHDIGIYMALGAQRVGVLRMVLLGGLRPTLAGMAIGLVASFALTRLMASQIYGVSATDPWTFVGVTAILGIVALAASYLPARRASRINPVIAIRHE